MMFEIDEPKITIILEHSLSLKIHSFTFGRPL